MNRFVASSFLGVLGLSQICHAGSFDLLEGNVGVDAVFDGDYAELPQSSPSSAITDFTTADESAHGEVSFDTAYSTNNLGGSVRLTASAGSPSTYSVAWNISVAGYSEVAFGPGSYFSYFAALQPGASFSSSAAHVNVSIPIPTAYSPQIGGHFSGVGLPLSGEPNGRAVDTLQYVDYAEDAVDDGIDNFPGQAESSLWVIFKYYNRVANPSPGDVDGDGSVNADDITSQSQGHGDSDGNGITQPQDTTYLIETILNTRNGDFNLDGRVDFNDYLIMQNNFGWTR